ncbi:MAG: TonB-dependent receptor, partial [Methylococcales bacterium]
HLRRDVGVAPTDDLNSYTDYFASISPIPLKKLFIVCLISISAHADETLTLQTMQVTAGRSTIDSFNVPTAITVIDQDDIEKQVPQILPDLLRGQTGVFVQETTPGQGIPIIRGLKGSEVLYLVDGMRLSNAIFRNSPNQYTAMLDPFNVESIEVLRGPSSSLYGGDAMGGVVQVMTPTPRFYGSEWQSNAAFDNSYASAENAFQTHMKLSAGNEKLAVLGGFGYQDFDDRVAGGGEEQAHSSFKSWASNSKVIYHPNNAHELLLDMQYYNQPKTPRYDELMPGYGQTNPSSSVFYFEPNERLFLHGRYRYTHNTPLFDSLEFHAAHQRITDDRRARDFGDSIETRERNASLLTGFTVQAALAHWPRSQLVYGFEFYHDEVDSRRFDTDINTGTASTEKSRFPNASTMDSYALYGNETLQLGERLQFMLGTRYSHYHTILAPADRGVGARLDHDDVTGNVGLSYLLIDGLKFVSNFGRGFRPPNVFDLGTLGSRPGNRHNIANPALTPETLLTWDGGFKFQNRVWQAEAIGFVTDYRDKITSVLTGDKIAGRDVVQNQNVNKVKLYGVEFGARFFASDQLELFSSVNYTLGDETFTDGKSLPADRIPPLNGRFGLHYTLMPTLWIESYTRFASRQNRLSGRDRDDPRINPAGTAGWATLNLRAGWKPHENWALQLSLENLLDKNYREHGSGIDATGVNVIASLHMTL